MNSLSRQALNYLSDSEKGDTLAQNKLCCLILLLDKEYKSKVAQLDEVLLFHILNHLSDVCIEAFKEYGVFDKSFEQLIKKLALSDLKLGDSQIMAFNRCTHFARVIAGELKSSVDSEVAFATDTAPDVEMEQNESVKARESVQTRESVDESLPPEEDIQTETEFNSIPAPEFHSIRIEGKNPPHKNKQFSQIYKLWNQDFNPTLKQNRSL